MIGVDTNVIVRLLVPDEPQRMLAEAFFSTRSAADPAFVSLVVVVELAWVLNRHYGYDFQKVRQAVQWLLDSDDFVVEHRDRVEWAVANYTRSKLDLPDLLIASAGEEAGVTTATFDRDAAKYVPGMELLK
ncbi:PIN domain-containing protein [Devosia sp. A16]|uniref:PIN domain-containing protein n=1 Tax=Devosia sp. A16 TaxID=1736675 RepID=UPI0006D7787D|nr:type II toxin-antitoxin system VapC family toxin [Devosia sp. A16]